MKNYKGLVFKGFSSMFFNSKIGRLEKREGLNLQKRLSPMGTSEEWFLDVMNEMLQSDCVLLPAVGVEHDALYGIKLVNEYRDF